MTDVVTYPRISEMSVERTAIDGLVVISVKEVEDERGVVREFYRESSWLAAGLPSLGPWLQVNVTETKPGALRGLHGEAMQKLVGIISGRAFGAFLDARPGSPTRGTVVTMELTLGRQVLVPNGVCNGFQSLGDTPSQYLYSFDAEWRPGMAGTAVNPLDPALAIPWPEPVVLDDPSSISTKDVNLPPFDPSE